MSGGNPHSTLDGTAPPAASPARAAHTRSGPKEAELPFVSILMPVRNEEGHIGRAVAAVLEQDYPADRLEVLVADGRSADGTRDILARLAARDARLKVIDNPGRIVATGLNAAIRQSRGEIVVRVDGHCEIAPDYVSRCVAHLSGGDADGVGGPLETVGETPVAKVIALAMGSGFGVGGSAFRTRKEWSGLVDTVAFPAYTREALVLAGPFDEELVRNQDDEYNYRLRSRGARILLAADVHARYYSRGTLRSLFRQYFQYGFWKVRVMQEHPLQMRPRQFVPTVFVACLLAGALAAPFTQRARHGLLGVGVAYAIANLVASVSSGRFGPFPGVLLLPIAFATLHLSYGLGFLAGLVRFGNRWSNTTLGPSSARRHDDFA